MCPPRYLVDDIAPSYIVVPSFAPPRGDVVAHVFVVTVTVVVVVAVNGTTTEGGGADEQLPLPPPSFPSPSTPPPPPAPPKRRRAIASRPVLDRTSAFRCRPIAERT
jgi:hypothetical protein